MQKICNISFLTIAFSYLVLVNGIEVRDKSEEINSSEEGLIKINASLAPAPEISEKNSPRLLDSSELIDTDQSSEQNITSSLTANATKFELDKGYFLPSPQIPFLEYNKYPVAPVFPQPKHLYNSKPVKFDTYLPPSPGQTTVKFSEQEFDNHGYLPPQNHDTSDGYLPPPTKPQDASGDYLPPPAKSHDNNGYLPPSPNQGHNRYPPPSQKDEGYLPPSPNQGHNRYPPPSQKDEGYLPPPKVPPFQLKPFWASKLNHLGTAKAKEQPPYPFHDALGPPPTVKSFSLYPHSEAVEKPRQHHNEMTSWKKMIHFLTHLLPIGLFLTALTPTLLTVTPVNSSIPVNGLDKKPFARSVEVDESLLDLLEGRLDDSSGCHQTRLLCHAAAKGRLPNASNLQKALWLIAKEAYEQKKGPKEFTELFKAIRTNTCWEISCESIEQKD